MSLDPPIQMVVSDSDDVWPALAAEIVAEVLQRPGRGVNPRRLMLTGGETATRLYRQLRSGEGTVDAEVELFIGDERGVMQDHPRSNGGMIRRELTSSGPWAGAPFHAIDGGANPDVAARRYELCIEEPMDVVLVSLGSDGHLASLFPGSEALCETDRLVVPVVHPETGERRITITPRVFAAAGMVIGLVVGSERGALLRRQLEASVGGDRSLPVHHLAEVTWVFDRSAGDAFQMAEGVAGCERLATRVDPSVRR